MDRMLHRGVYAPPESAEDREVNARPVSRLAKLIGIDGNFTLTDKWIAGGLLAWGVFWFVVMAVGSIWNLISPWSAATWSTFWHIFGIGAPVFFCAATGIWFTWGGIRDIFRLFVGLRAARTNSLDDGSVVGHQNRDEIAHDTAITTSAK